MFAVNAFVRCSWQPHLLQQDGVLLEPGGRPDCTAAKPLKLPEGKGAIYCAERALYDATGLTIRIVEKDFYEPTTTPSHPLHLRGGQGISGRFPGGSPPGKGGLLGGAGLRSRCDGAGTGARRVDVMWCSVV